MLHYITQIIDVTPFEVVCRFNTDEVRRINLLPLLEKYAGNTAVPFSKLLKAEYFKTVHLDTYGTLSWDNEVDFCPDVLYDLSVAA